MNNFLKDKIVYALALLGALFALKPIVDEIGEIKVDIGLLDIRLTVIYLITMGILGLAVYMFSVNFLTETPIRWVVKVGNFCYGASLFIPIIVLILWLINIAISFVTTKANVVYNISLILSILSTLISLLVNIKYVMKKLNNIDIRNMRNSTINNEIKTIERGGKKLLDMGMYSNSVLELFSGLEYSVRSIVNHKGISYDRKKIQII